MGFIWMGMVLALLDGGSDWNQWRGPQRDGSTKMRLPDQLPDNLSREWRVAVGEGYGSPVMEGDRVYLLTAEEGREKVLCLSAKTGKVLWQFAYPVEFKENSYALKYGKGPFATPLVAQGIVYTLGITGEVHALDSSEGKVLWQDSFDGDLTGDRLLFCGNSVSPLLVNDRLITHAGDESHGRMTAFNPTTGQKIWTWEDDISGYASPIVVSLAGKQQIVSMTQNQIVGIDPQNGRQLWGHPYQVQWRENIVTPVIHQNGIVISGREQGATVKLGLRQEGGRWQVDPLWRNEEQVMYMSSPILVGDRLYGFSHKSKGRLFSLNAKDGLTLATGPGRQGDSAALIRAGDYLLSLTTGGELSVFSLGTKTFEPVRTYQVADSQTWAHPLLTPGRIIVKDKTHLTSWTFR